MADDVQGLATGRSRRSTAGNRMAAALAEMEIDGTNQDLDDDIEFFNEKDEEDVFESDFASTDEEAAPEDIDAGDKAVQEEEKSARKAARSQLEKRTAAAHAKHKATFNPQVVAPSVDKPKPKLKLTISSDVPESGTKAGSSRAGQKRKSQRRHTVLNTSATDSRMRETEEKKASAPKKFKPTVKTFSQAELIQRALDNEEGNIKEHKNYLSVEEEKRKKARVIKMPAVEGPLLRWISKAEDEKFKVQVEVTPPAPQPSISATTTITTAATTTTYPNYTAAQLNTYYAQLYHYLATQPGALSAMTAQVNSATSASTLQPAMTGHTLTSRLVTVPSTSSATATPSTSSTMTTPAATTGMVTPAPSTTTVPPNAVTSTTVSSSTAVPSSTAAASSSTVVSPTAIPSTTTASSSTATAFSTFRLPNTVNPYPFTYYTPGSITGTTSPSTFQPTLFTPTTTTAPAQPPPKQYVEEERTERVTKNYVVCEAGQREGIAKPPWKDMMKALFGDHVKWDELKMLSGKGRPLARVKQRCPITGEIAPYLDPRTGIPFADVEAYKILTDLLEHGYVWSPELGCYI